MRDKRPNKVAMNFYVQLDGNEIILHGGLNKKDSETNAQRITVYVKTKSEADIEEEKARIAIAKSKQNYAREVVLKGYNFN